MLFDRIGFWASANTRRSVGDAASEARTPGVHEAAYVLAPSGTAGLEGTDWRGHSPSRWAPPVNATSCMLPVKRDSLFEMAEPTRGTTFQ